MADKAKKPAAPVGPSRQAIRVNERAAFERDTHGWTAWFAFDGVSKTDGRPIKVWRPSYYGKLEHACEYILDCMAGNSGATDVVDLIAAIAVSRDEIVGAVRRAAESQA